jgi:hypothetical protein
VKDELTIRAKWVKEEEEEKKEIDEVDDGFF